MENVSKEQSALPVAISPTTTNPSESGPSVLPRRYRWRPTFWRVRPLIGIVALLTTTTCLLISLAILKASNGDPTYTWSFQPTVYLAISTAVSNTALQCALSQAAPISWWYKALQGSTVKDLELDWEAGQGFPRAFIKSYRYRRMLSLFSLASFATAFVLIDGALLQRSSSVRRATIVDNVSLNISLAPQLPTGFSVDISKVGNFGYTPAAIAVYEAHVHKRPIISSTFCNGTCQATVRGPGYTSMGCRNQTWLINENMLRDPNSTWGIGLHGIIGGADNMAPQPLLTSEAAPAWDPCVAGREPMFVSIGNANYRNCHGTFKFANCTMMPAVLEYDVTIQGNTIAYRTPTNLNRVAGLAGNSCSNGSTLATTGFLGLLEPYITSNGSLGLWEHLPPGKHPVESPYGGSFSSFGYSYVELIPGNDLCTFISYDPMDDIIAQFNDLLFRAGLIAGSWANITDLLVDAKFPIHQVVRATMTREENVFHSNLNWFFGAAAVQILTMLLILPAYWGWWNIGVELTLSPFHTAKAFDAPLLRGVNSAAGSTGVVDDAGDMRLKLGAVDIHSPTNRSRIGIDVPGRVVRPLKGARFTD